MGLRKNPDERKKQIIGYREKYKKNGMAKEWQNKCRYGLGIGERSALAEKQKYLCPACGKPFGDRTIAIDHDHVTGVVRGLIHRQCNSMIGLAKEDPEILEKAAAYLRSKGGNNE